MYKRKLEMEMEKEKKSNQADMRGESEALHNEWNLSIKLEWKNPRRKYQSRKAWDGTADIYGRYTISRDWHAERGRGDILYIL